ncbi:MAG TPA: exodeoxyribonuclease V subunit alpha [Rhodanobacteraceae bacterium]|nr:exodeoxyribonuclease V subunit alpha [Rhodanobacteraceae bacterium]
MSARLEPWVRNDWLRRADAALAAWVARAFPEAAPEVALAAALAARAVGDGHSALELARAREWLARLGGQGKPPELPDTESWQISLRAAAGACRSDGSTAVAPLTLDPQGRVYLSRYFDAEQRVAVALTAHALAEGAAAREAQAVAGHGTLDREQQRAIDVALTRGFTLITGGPGSGKTFIVAYVLAALAEAAGATPPRIALAAPTGKAAARLAESLRAQLARMALPAPLAASLPREPATLHRLLGISSWRAQPRHHAGAPLPFDVVVVDEASMVDLPLMARLVDALAPHARLILLGDPNQLAAVEAGNVLAALVDACRDDPFAACHVALSGSHRFGARSEIGALARAIATDNADAALAVPAVAGPEVQWVDDNTQGTLVEHACDAFAPLLAAGDPAAALAAARGFRVLTALRHGPWGCLAINRAIEARLKRMHAQRADGEWWQGRLVLVVANRPELGIFNGDTGIVWHDADGQPQVWFEGADGVPRAIPPAALPPHEGAFALTVHKAQGSEFERILLATGPDSAVLTRELLYTGVTRARSGLTLYADAETLRAGIARPTLRMTGLADRLREAAGT